MLSYSRSRFHSMHELTNIFMSILTVSRSQSLKKGVKNQVKQGMIKLLDQFPDLIGHNQLDLGTIN